MKKSLPVSSAALRSLVEKYETPFQLYFEDGIRETQRKMNEAFSWVEGFRNYYAVKAAPNPYLMKILKAEGGYFDCSSLAELELVHLVGSRGEEVMFTSNDTPAHEFERAMELGAIINLDDITHLDFLEEVTGLPDLICFRYNPGALRSGNDIIGEPAEAKFGCTREQIFEGLKQAKAKGVKRFGLHTMIVSNELSISELVRTAEMMFTLAKDVHEHLGIRVEFVNLGGGIGVAMHPSQEPVSFELLSTKIRAVYEDIIAGTALEPLRIVMECGRVMTGPHGVLVTKVIHKKETYKSYIGVDACMAHLMRPALYGAYHHLSVLGKGEDGPQKTYDVVGSLCENNDKFAVDRTLPETEIGDVIVIHDTGAHGHAMGFNYNGKTRSAEYLLRADGTVTLIRRKETLEDLFATLDFEKLGDFC